ncbi:MAG: hypothetical protein ABI411_06800 [Tahibacter sp.]
MCQLIRRCIAFFAFSTLFGTAAMAAVYQTPEMRRASLPLTSRMRIDLRLSEPRLCLQVPGTNAMMFGGGLIGVLIETAVDNSRARSAERSIAQIRESLGELPIEATLRAALETRLERSVFAPELDIGLLAVGEDGRPDRRAQTEAARVLVLVPSFCFDKTATVLKFAINATIEDRVRVDRRLRAKLQYLVNVEFAYDDAAVKSLDNRDARMELWARKIDRARALRLLTESVDGAVAQLNHAMRARNEDNDDGEKIRYEGNGNSIRAHVLRTEQGRTWMKLNASGDEVSVGALPTSGIDPADSR